MTRTVARTRRRLPPTRDDSQGSPSTATSARSTISPLAMRSPAVQPKLTVNQPGDKYEREADAVASKVVHNTPAPQAQTTIG
ncbi:MAG: hypothetical protein AAF215_22720 [Cyanobacteria bacterium P01_A01_bin.123]